MGLLIELLIKLIIVVVFGLAYIIWVVLGLATWVLPAFAAAYAARGQVPQSLVPVIFLCVLLLPGFLTPYTKAFSDINATFVFGAQQITRWKRDLIAGVKPISVLSLSENVLTSCIALLIRAKRRVGGYLDTLKARSLEKADKE